MGNPERITDNDSDKVISPFQETEATVSASASRTGNWTVVASIGLLTLLAVSMGAFVSYLYLNDPFRTLEPLPVGSYYEDYRSLAGSKFKGELTVTANLGWKAEIGKLMVFSLADDPRPIAVLVSPEESSIAFQKGQTYLAELEVGEGGVIYAKSFQKE